MSKKNRGIIDTLEESTKKVKGKRYQSHKFCYDTMNNSVITYDADREVEWEQYGESIHFKKVKNLTFIMEDLKKEPSWFKYFLDGSRYTYKVDDMSFGNNVYPIIAGQIGISCCKRKDKKIMKEFFDRKIVISLPTSAVDADFKAERDIERLRLLEKLNKSEKLKQKNLQLNDVLLYNLDTDDKYENKGIAKIQDYMIECEKKAVIELVKSKKVKENAYLLKDGSLEYKVTNNKDMNLTEARMKNSYRYVIGVSKSFNPTMCYVNGGGTNSSVIANLKVNERTPACCFKSKISGKGVWFCVWYLRLRDSRYTQNVFDGVIKVEKLIQEDEKEDGVDTELIDTISAFLLMERNPVCYGRDNRWANHLYPIYVTESFAKSKYMHNSTFLSLF